MTTSRSALIGGSIVLVALIFGIAWLSVYQFVEASICSDKLLRRLDSPDGKFSLNLFSRSCGATTADSIQANIQPVASQLNSEKYQPFLVVDAPLTVAPTWNEARQITVRLGGVGQIYRSDAKSGSVQIKYLQ